MNIRVDLKYAIKDGTEVVFRSPVDCSQVTGLKVYYPEDGISVSKEFAFSDAHGNNVGDIPHLFAENVVVKVILDVTTGMAFVQNADTNAYIERTFVKTVNGKGPDENGNVQIEVGSDSSQNANCLPEYSEADNGKVLGIVDGTPAWVEATVSGGGSGDSGGTDEPETPEVTTHGIVWDLVNVSTSNAVASVNHGESLSAVLTAADGYILGDVTVTMGGEVLTGVWNADTATITIASVTGDVIVSCAAIEQTGPVDTTAKIAQYDKGFYWGAQIEAADYTGACVTVPYQFTHDIDKLKSNSSYDAENDYMTGITMFPKVMYYVPNAKFIEAGNSLVSTKTKIAHYRDDTIFTVGSMTLNAEKGATVGGKNDANYLYATGIAFTLFTADVDDSYAYWSITGSQIAPIGIRHGDVIFAGKNTPYYGMANIDGTMVGAEVAVLSVDGDIAQDYVVATTSILGEELSPRPDAAYGVSAEFAEMFDGVRRTWMKEYGGDWRKIPLIITTDQHGRVYSSVFNLIGKTQNMHEVSKICNLGDTVESLWVDSDADNPLLTYWELDSWMSCMSEIPFSKRLDVFGNHDTWYRNASGEEVTLTEFPHLNQYFKNIYARRTNNNGWFAVKDDFWNVKYVVVSGFDYTTSRSQYRIGTAQMTWLIDELGKDDGYDIVVISHVPLCYVTENMTFPTGYTPMATENYRVSNVDTDALFAGRKNKLSGTVMDSDGVEHSFDFTKCTSNVLCALHGHTHHDAYNYIGTDGLLSLSFDYFAGTTVHLVLIDRENRQLNVWKVEGDALTYTNYQVPFDKVAE